MFRVRSEDYKKDINTGVGEMLHQVGVKGYGGCYGNRLWGWEVEGRSSSTEPSGMFHISKLNHRVTYFSKL
jgi:hypothetical protein